ncbi:MAG TPA: hypothetical protein VHA06_13655, partial [Candidatus Angelobacter sp.]|nr:hypothetical protein [Candidatus Angelobacter sp.]
MASARPQTTPDEWRVSTPEVLKFSKGTTSVVPQRSNERVRALAPEGCFSDIHQNPPKIRHRAELPVSKLFRLQIRSLSVLICPLRNQHRDTI